MATVYALSSEAAPSVGGSTGALSEGNAQRLILACIVATLWVAERVGAELAVPVLAPPYTEERATVDPRWTAATIVAAGRFYRSPDIPFGVLGGLGDMAVNVKVSIPEAELVLFGARTGDLAWGIG